MIFYTAGILHQAGFVSTDGGGMGNIKEALIAYYVKEHNPTVCSAFFCIRLCFLFLVFQFFALKQLAYLRQFCYSKRSNDRVAALTVKSIYSNVCFLKVADISCLGGWCH